jgi:hypothetical protein|nr:MAG TPA: DNA primase [Caudoviricetes sp.]
MITYDKSEIRNNLTIYDVFELLSEFGGDPEYTSFGILSSTICHNKPGDGSRKLYFYENSTLFHCYTGCDEPSFDIFELMIKIMSIQNNTDWDLNDAVRFVAQRFGIAGTEELEDGLPQLDDWKYLSNYNKIEEISTKSFDIILKEYDKSILNKFNYNIKLTPWLNDGIDQYALDLASIGFYPGGDQITIPHFDENSRLVGLRGRSLCLEEAERFGKYRPLKVNGIQYNHPLGMNLYGLNWARKAIKIIGKAIIFESEKSVLQYISMFGIDSDIAVACCGSNVSAFQINSLINAGAKEIIIALDRQFQEIGDKEFKHLTKNLTNLGKRYNKYVIISCIFDKHMITSYKSSPTDEGKEKFLQLYKERIIL